MEVHARGVHTYHRLIRSGDRNDPLDWCYRKPGTRHLHGQVGGGAHATPAAGAQLGPLLPGRRHPTGYVLGRPSRNWAEPLHHLPGQHRLVQFVGTVADRPEAGGAIPLLDRKIARVSESPADLDGSVQHGQHHLGDMGLDHPEFGPNLHGTDLVHLPGGLEREQSRRLNLHVRERDVVLDHLVLPQELAVRLSRDGTLTHDVQGPLGLPEPAHGVVDPTASQALLRQDEPITWGTDQVIGRHPTVAKDDLCMVAVLAELGDRMGHRADVPHDLHPGGSLGHHRRRKRACGGGFRGSSRRTRGSRRPRRRW